MNTCASCGTANIEGSQFCDQCGALLKTTASLGARNGGDNAAPSGMPQMVTPIPAYVPPASVPEVSRSATPSSADSAADSNADEGPATGHTPVNVTSLGGLLPSEPGAPPAVALETMLAVSAANAGADDEAAKNVHAKLIIERGTGVGQEFSLSTEEAYIGRWDADNGIFPDVDLDAHDPEAKVSRRHARITYKDGNYALEDLGSTNGTFINRGRRLLPGNPHLLSENDEIIVGKTFLRFHAIK